mgnify:CR=1 FL=1
MTGVQTCALPICRFPAGGAEGLVALEELAHLHRIVGQRFGRGVDGSQPAADDDSREPELQVGDTFGEEALISEAKRNATVTMATDGSLMRLGKEDFRTLLNEPMLDWVDREQAEKIINEGGKWLDVRLPSEFEAYHNDGAINVPLYFIRLKLKTLDPATRYIVCCDTGRRSSAGAFILSERGFQTFVLKGGLNGTGQGA